MTNKVNLKFIIQIGTLCCIFGSLFGAATIVNIHQHMFHSHIKAIILFLLVTLMLLSSTMVDFNAVSESHTFTSIYGLGQVVYLTEHEVFLLYAELSLCICQSQYNKRLCFPVSLWGNHWARNCFTG